MGGMNIEDFEVVYVPLPKDCFYDPESWTKAEESRCLAASEKLIENVRRDLENRTAKKLARPIVAFRWLGPDGSTLWFDHRLRPVKDDEAAVYQFVDAMLDSIRDGDTPIFVVFEDHNEAQAKFCVRFTLCAKNETELGYVTALLRFMELTGTRRTPRIWAGSARRLDRLAAAIGKRREKELLDCVRKNTRQKPTRGVEGKSLNSRGSPQCGEIM
jgi:hypothetical protein